MIKLKNDEMIIKAWIPEIVNTDTGYIPVLISNTDKYNILKRKKTLKKQKTMTLTACPVCLV